MFLPFLSDVYFRTGHSLMSFAEYIIMSLIALRPITCVMYYVIGSCVGCVCTDIHRNFCRAAVPRTSYTVANHIIPYYRGMDATFSVLLFVLFVSVTRFRSLCDHGGRTDDSRCSIRAAIRI